MKVSNPSASSPAGTVGVLRFRFPPDVIMIAVRLYLRYNLSYCDVEELLIERGVEADHVTVFRLVQRFTHPRLQAARHHETAAAGKPGGG